MVLIDANPARLLRKFEVYQAPKNSKAEWAIRMTHDLDDK